MAQYTIDKFTYGGNTYKLKDKNALQLTGGTVTGPVIFGDSVTMDSFNAEAGVINGNLSVAGTIYGNITGNVTGNVSGIAGGVAWGNVSSKPNLVNTITTTAGAHTTISSSTGNVSFNVPTTAAHVGIKFGYTTSGNNRAVQQDSSGNLYVVQKDDNTTYSFTDNNPTLAWGTKSKVATVGGVDIHVTMPSNPNTNTTYSLTQDASDGHKITLTPSSGTAQTITIPDNNTNTWRGIQDNLTSSTNTTESLSAKQGYLLANGSARDSTKLPLAGGTLTGCLRIKPTNDTNWSEGIRIYSASNGWTTLLLGGTDNTADTGTSANSWSLHSHNGNFYIARNGSDTSSSALLKCESNIWSWNGTASGSISGNAATATMPLGFSSRVTDATWGNTTGTSFTSWNDPTGGSIDFRRDNPSSGKMSIKVDGRFYFNEGTTCCAGLTKTNGYWGLTGADGETDTSAWIRTTQAGLIPYQAGGRGSGHCFLGTDDWSFGSGYIDNIYTVNVNASGKSYFGDTTTITDAVIGNLNATGYASFGETNLISYGTADLSSGSSPLATGHIYVVYE